MRGEIIRQRALRMATRLGNVVTFRRGGGGGTYNPATDTWSAGTEQSASAPAVEKRGDPDRFRALGLVLTNPVTLVVTRPSDMPFAPTPGDLMDWSGTTYTVQDVEPSSLDGNPVMWSVTGSL